jgi:hypothetical protein
MPLSLKNRRTVLHVGREQNQELLRIEKSFRLESIQYIGKTPVRLRFISRLSGEVKVYDIVN